MMKKYGKIIVLFTLFVFSLNSYVYAVPNNLWESDQRQETTFGGATTVSTKGKDIIQELLMKLGIMETSEEFNPDEKATVHEYLRAFAVIEGVYHESLSDEQLLGSLNEAGITNMANLPKRLTMEDMVYSGVRLTGFYLEAEKKGGEAVNYQLTASRNKLLYNVNYTANGAVTKGELAQFIFNAITVRSRYITSIDGDDAVFSVPNGEATILEKRFGVVAVEGILNGAYVRNIYGDSGLQKDEAEIDRIKYKTEQVNLLDYVGKSVTAFVEKIGADADKILYIDINDKNNVYSFSDDDVKYFRNSSFHFTGKIDGVSSIRVKEAETKVMYNYVIYNNYTEASMQSFLENGAEITCVDNNGDGTADVVFVCDYSSFKAMNGGNKIYFEYEMRLDGLRYVDAEEDKNNIVEVYKDGQPVKNTDIKAGDIVSVLKSPNNYGRKYTKIVASTKKENVKITSISNDGKYEIGTEKTDYKLTREFAAACGFGNASLNRNVDVPTLGFKYEVYLTFDGRIADAKQSGDDLYGYIISAGYKRLHLKEIAQVKMLGEDGEINTYDLKDKVKYFSASYPEGTKIKSTEVIDNIYAANPADYRCMVMYKKNDQGLISEIYQSFDNTAGVPGSIDYPLTLDFVGSKTNKIRFYNGSLIPSGGSGKYQYSASSNILVFEIPPAEFADNERLYTVSKLGKRGADKTYENMSVFGVDEYGIAKLCLLKGTSSSVSMPYDKRFSVIDKIIGARNDEGEDVTRIKYWYEGAYTYSDIETDCLSAPGESWYSGVKLSELKFGDVVQLDIAADNTVNAFRLILRNSDKGSYRSLNNVGTVIDYMTFDNLGVYFGKVLGTKEDIVRVRSNEDDVNPQIFSHTYWNKGYGGGTYYIYIVDNETKEISPGTREDVMPDDIVVIRKVYAATWELVVFR